MLSKKNIMLSMALLFSAAHTFGYNFMFSNITERTIIISYKLAGLSSYYYQILLPDQSISHYFPNAHCFAGTILWSELKTKDARGKELPFQGGLDLLDEETGTLDQEKFGKTLANKYAFIPMQIKVVDNETFQMTAQAAQEFMQGIDSLACGTIKTVSMFMNPLDSVTSSMGSSSSMSSGSDMGSSIASSMGSSMSSTSSSAKKSFDQTSCKFGLGQIAKGGVDLAGSTLCKDIHFAIVDTGEIGSPTNSKTGKNVSRIQKPILIAEITQGE